MEEVKKTNFNLVDVLKLFFCICVIAIHTNALENVNENLWWYVLHCICRVAVPFFFVASGFFYGLKVVKNRADIKNITKKYLIKLLIPFIFWIIINIPIVILDYRNQGLAMTDILVKLAKQLPFYPIGALWYVLALIVAICLLYFFIKKKKLKLAIVLGIALYCFALISNSYYFLIEGNQTIKNIVDTYVANFISPRNGLFVGFLFVGIGAYIAEMYYQKKIIFLRENKQKRKHFIGTIILFIISLITIFLEASFIRGKHYIDDHGLFVSLIYLVPTMFIIALNIKMEFNLPYKKMRELSTGMYFIHRPILGSITLLTTSVGITFGTGVVSFLIVTILSAGIVLLLQKSNNKIIQSII